MVIGKSHWRVTKLLSDYRPSGAILGDDEPAFLWAVEGIEPPATVVAHQVLAASSPGLLVPGEADLWDSGRVSGGRWESRYGGRPLESRQRCWWTVRVWVDDGASSELAEPAYFELGLRPDDWTSDWIGYPGGWYGQVLRMRRRWQVRDGARIARANVYVASPCWHQLTVNGRTPDDRVLEPAPTVLSKRLICSCYDVGDSVGQRAKYPRPPARRRLVRPPVRARPDLCRRHGWQNRTGRQ